MTAFLTGMIPAFMGDFMRFKSKNAKNGSSRSKPKSLKGGLSWN